METTKIKIHIKYIVLGIISVIVVSIFPIFISTLFQKIYPKTDYNTSGYITKIYTHYDLEIGTNYYFVVKTEENGVEKEYNLQTTNPYFYRIYKDKIDVSVNLRILKYHNSKGGIVGMKIYLLETKEDKGKKGKSPLYESGVARYIFGN